jgi:hypothetical protein
MKPDDLALESFVRTKLERWCQELQWQYEPRVLYCEIKPGVLDPVYAEWRHLRGIPLVKLWQPLTLYPHDKGPWPPEVLGLLLRRNYDLGSVYWCVSLHDGLAVAAVRPVESLTAEKLRLTVERLKAEQADIVAVAEKEWPSASSDSFAEEIEESGREG